MAKRHTTPTLGEKSPSTEYQLDPARASNVRGYNLTLVANAVISSSLHCSRADLARLTGLNRSTVTRLVDHLISYGIIRELHSENNGNGRPATPLAPALHTYASIGIDISHTSIEASLIDLSGEILAQHYQQISTAHPTHTLSLLAHTINDLAAKAHDAGLSTVGATLACHGLISTDGKSLLSSPTLRWKNVNIDEHLLPLIAPTNLPVTLMNSSHAGAYAEIFLRNKQESPLSDFLYVTAGGGIDAAIIRNGTFEAGMHGWAGEIGHTYAGESEIVCSCGNTGCLETFASQQALLQTAGLDSDIPLGTFLAQLARKKKEAREAVRIAGKALGIALSSFINMVDMTTIVLDGLFAQLFSDLEPYVREEIEKRLLSSPFTSVDILPSVSTSNSITLGAAWKGITSFIENPSLWQKQSEEQLNYYPISQTPSVDIEE